MRTRHPLTLSAAAILLFWLVPQAPSCAGETPPSVSNVPDWALGVLTFSCVSRCMGKISDYAEKIHPGTGSLASNAMMNVLFKLPVDGAFLRDDPAWIYILEPFNPGPSQVTALVLHVADRAALKTSLTAIYGEPQEADGVMTFTLPQPLPEPDKLLLVKVTGNLALVAPSAQVLKNLETLAAKENHPFPILESADMELSLNAAAFSRLYGRQFVDIIGTLAVILPVDNVNEDINPPPKPWPRIPQRENRLAAQLKSIVDSLPQLDTVTLSITWDADTNASVELALNPLPGTALAACFKGLDAPLDRSTLNCLPPDNVLTLLWSGNPVAVINEAEAALEGSVGAMDKAKSKKFASAVSDFLNCATGGGALTANVSENNFEGMISLSTVEPPKAAEKLAACYAQFVDELNGKDAELEIQPLAASEHAGVQVSGLTVGLKGVSSDGQIQQVLDKKFGIRHAAVGQRLVASSGGNGGALLENAIDREQKKEPLAADLQTLVGAAHAGTAVLLALRPMTAAKIALSMLLPKDAALSADALLTGLSPAPIALSVFVSGGKAGLQLQLPPAALSSMRKLSHRLRQGHISLEELYNSAFRTDAPAPPAPEPAEPPAPKGRLRKNSEEQR